MDPISLGVMGVVGTAASAGATMLGASAQADAMRAQAAADRQKAQIEAQWAERRAKEERAAAQRAAFGRNKEAKLAQSRLIALTGASGSRVDDPTVLELFGDIEQQGKVNEATEYAGGLQRGAGLEFGADLAKWAADTNASIKERAASPTMLGGMLGGIGQLGSGLSSNLTRMGMRYGSPSMPSHRYG